MDTKKLPPALLLALGLGGCGDDGNPEMEASACLSIGSESLDGTVSACLSTTGLTSDSSSGDSSSSVGPCLDVIPPTSGTTGTGTGTDSDTDTDTDTDGETTTGPCLVPLPTTTGGPDGGGDREEVLHSLLDRLPKDVAAKLAKDGD